MTARKFPMDRSAMWTALLDVDPKFGRMEMNDGSARVTAALEDWYRSSSADMYRFAQQWANEH